MRDGILNKRLQGQLRNRLTQQIIRYITDNRKLLLPGFVLDIQVAFHHADLIPQRNFHPSMGEGQLEKLAERAQNL